MVATLREGMAEAHVDNVRIVQSRWPMADAPSADVGLIAHVGYDIGEIGPFLDALEASSRRLCAAVVGEAAMTTVATLFWQEIHGEPRVRLPAMPEFVGLLIARGRLPELRWVERVRPSFDSIDDALAMARRQLWLREGSSKDQRLEQLAAERLVLHDGRFTFDDRASQIGVATWAPR
jgi:hypothetical protein